MYPPQPFPLYLWWDDPLDYYSLPLPLTLTPTHAGSHTRVKLPASSALAPTHVKNFYTQLPQTLVQAHINSNGHVDWLLQ